MVDDILNPDLLKAIRVLAISDNPKTRRTLYEALLASTFILPTAEPAQNLGGQSSISLMQGQTSDGQALVLAFTDVDALKAWQPDGSYYIVMDAPEVFKLLLGHDAPLLMINIAGPVGGEVTPYEMEKLAAGEIPASPEAIAVEMLEDKTQLEINPLKAKPPQNLVAFLKHQFPQHDAILSAYLFDLTVEGQITAMTCGVEFEDAVSSEYVDETLRELAASVNAEVAPDGLTFMPLQGDMMEYAQTALLAIYSV